MSCDSKACLAPHWQREAYRASVDQHVLSLPGPSLLRSLTRPTRNGVFDPAAHRQEVYGWIILQFSVPIELVCVYKCFLLTGVCSYWSVAMEIGRASCCLIFPQRIVC